MSQTTLGSDAQPRAVAPDRGLRTLLKQALTVKGERPRTELWEDAVTMGLALLTLVALYWDGLRHNNIAAIDTFWSPAHIVMYVGLISLGGWIGLTLLRHQPRGKKLELSLSAVPMGYGLALVALPLAGLGGPGDFIWHSIYGFENQVDAPFSPTHQMLFLSGALLAAIPLASTWARSGRAPGMRKLLPAILSMTAIVAVIEFTFMNILPFFYSMVPTRAFQDDLARYPDAYEPGTHVHHSEGLAQATAHYGDQAWPYYLFSNMQAVAGMMIFTAVFVGAVLYLRRRWVLPVGTLTITCCILAFLFPWFTSFRYWGPSAALVVAGLVGDLLLRRLLGEDPIDTLRVRAFAALMPIAIWGSFLLFVALESGLGWNPTMYLGVLSTSAGVGYGIALISFPRPLPAAAVEEAV